MYGEKFKIYIYPIEGTKYKIDSHGEKGDVDREDDNHKYRNSEQVNQSWPETSKGVKYDDGEDIDNTDE